MLLLFICFFIGLFYSNYSFHLTDRESQNSRFQIPIEECEDIHASDLAIKRLVRLEVNEILGGMNEKEAEILSLYFGIDRDRRYTLEEIGGIYDISKERVRQIREKALASLREKARTRKLEIFMNLLLEAQ